MSKPRYVERCSKCDYEIVKVTPDIVFIIDLDIGNVSITNDAERVYCELKNLFPTHRIVYRDSMGHWDEIVLDIELSGFARGYIYCGFAPFSNPTPDESEFCKFPSSALLRK